MVESWKTSGTMGVDYEKHGPLVKNVGEVNVIHVDLREPWSGRKKP